MAFKSKINNELYNKVCNILTRDTKYSSLVVNIRKESKRRNERISSKFFLLDYPKSTVLMFRSVLIFAIAFVLVNPIISSDRFIHDFSQLNDVLIGVCATLLGFLITGYAVFTAFLNREFSVFMLLSLTDGERSNDFRKTNHFFIMPFVTIINLLVFSFIAKVAIVLILNKDSYSVIEFLNNFANIFNFIFSLYVSYMTLNVFKVIKSLKSFIFNIYHIAVKIADFSLLMDNYDFDLNGLIEYLNFNYENREE